MRDMSTWSPCTCQQSANKLVAFRVRSIRNMFTPVSRLLGNGSKELASFNGAPIGRLQQSSIPLLDNPQENWGIPPSLINTSRVHYIQRHPSFPHIKSRTRFYYYKCDLFEPMEISKYMACRCKLAHPIHLSNWVEDQDIAGRTVLSPSGDTRRIGCWRRTGHPFPLST